MLHLIYDVKPVDDTDDFYVNEIRLETDKESELRLHDLCQSGMLDVSNPARDFAVRMNRKGTGYDDDEETVRQAEFANDFCELWKNDPNEIGGEASKNIFQLFTILVEKYLELLSEYESLKETLEI